MASKTEMTTDSLRCQVWNEDSILDTLQHELIELKDKIENARKREDYGTYKNLILAFKEVVHLVHEEEERNKPKTITTNKLVIEGDVSFDNFLFPEYIEKEVTKPTYIALYSNIVKLSANDDYSTIQIPLPDSIRGISEDKLLLMTELYKNEYESNEIGYWIGSYGKIENGFINLSAINTAINKDSNEKYNKDISVEYRIFTKNK